MTTEERLENLENELVHVKRRNRWLVGGVLLAAGAWVTLAGFKGNVTAAARTEVEDRFQQAGEGLKIVRANAFVLEDMNGKARAVLGIIKDAPTLNLLDENSELRAVLGVGRLGPALSLYDENGKERAALGMTKLGPALRLADENGEGRVVLGTPKSGLGLALYDENSKLRTGLAVPKSGAGLRLYDEKGKQIWQAP